MDKVLKPDRFECLPNAPDATKRWRHWLVTFDNFVNSLPQENINKLQILINYVSLDVYDLITESNDFDEALSVLKSLYSKTPSEIFARHSLSTCRQAPNESIDEYLQCLKTLSKDCNFKTVTALQRKDEAVREAFISGLSSTAVN